MREIIEIKTKADLETLIFKNTFEELLFIKGIILNVDLEDQYINREAIIKRTTDNKYFKLLFQQDKDFNLSYNEFPIIGKEVFPKTITKIIYE